MQQGYREWKAAGCIKLQGTLWGNRESSGYFGVDRPGLEGAWGIEINTLFEQLSSRRGVTIHTSHPGRGFEAFVALEQGSLPSVSEEK
jgi:hypothetical protein